MLDPIARGVRISAWALLVMSTGSGCTLRFTASDASVDAMSPPMDAGLDAPPADAPQADAPGADVPGADVPTIPVGGAIRLASCPLSASGATPFVEHVEAGRAISDRLQAMGSWGTTKQTLLVDLDGDRDLDVVAIDELGLPPVHGHTATGVAPNVAMRSDLDGCVWSLVDESAERLPEGPRVVDPGIGVVSALAVPIYGRGIDLVVPSMGARGDVHRVPEGVRWAQGTWETDATGQPQLPGAGATAGDVDGDGLLDVVVRWSLTPGAVAARTRLVRQTLAGGTRTFTISSAGFSVSHAWLAQLDADPELELLTTAAVDEGAAWPEAERAGQSAHVMQWSAGDGAMLDQPWAGLEHVAFGGHVALGDVDVDGDLDLVQLHRPFDPGTQTYAAAWRLEWLENDGAGFVQHLIRDDVPGFYGGPWAAIVADVDLDGFPDVVVTDWSMRVLLSPRADRLDPYDFREVPDSALQQGDGAPSFGDVDGDGDIDVLVPGRQRETAFAERVAARVYLNGASAARLRLLPEVDGVPAYGAEVCVYARGERPVGDTCGGPLLGYGQIIASTSASIAPEVVVAMRGASSADVRVRWASVGGGRAVTDFDDLAPGSYALPRP